MANETGTGPHFEAPEVTPERNIETPEIDEGQIEQQRPAAAESSPGKQTPAILNAPPAIPTDLTQDQAASAPVPTTARAISDKTADLTARDSDLIEKQWVTRAKSIIEQTRSDPYRQKHEMSKVKADYIQKRFKKTIKTDDAVGK